MPSSPDPGARPVLISAAELHRVLSSGEPVHLLDVRWSLTAPDGRPGYRAGHLPGAVLVDLPTELAGPPEPLRGRHPLPEARELERSARRWGLRRGAPVVVYDDAGGTSAARAWWLLGHAGVADVRILDGALDSWRSAGLPLETGDGRPSEPGDVVLEYGHRAVIDAAEAAAFPATGTLLDARAAERYRGESEPVDPRAGHIPGAVSSPASRNLAPDGRFLPAARLAEEFAAVGAGPDRPVAVYCGSGVTAAHTIAALAVAGRQAALFPGSWSAWSADPARPAATGPGPSPDGAPAPAPHPDPSPSARPAPATASGASA